MVISIDSLSSSQKNLLYTEAFAPVKNPFLVLICISCFFHCSIFKVHRRPLSETACVIYHIPPALSTLFFVIFEIFFEIIFCLQIWFLFPDSILYIEQLLLVFAVHFGIISPHRVKNNIWKQIILFNYNNSDA